HQPRESWWDEQRIEAKVETEELMAPDAWNIRYDCAGEQRQYRSGSRNISRRDAENPVNFRAFSDVGPDAGIYDSGVNPFIVKEATSLDADVAAREGDCEPSSEMAQRPSPR